jgi:peptidoglycan-associated lipoprotein
VVEAALQLVVVSPSRVPPNVANPATLIGAGFQAGARVIVGSSPVGSVDFIDENSLRVVLPPLPVGTYDVSITNPDGKRDVLTNGLLVADGVALRPTGCELTRVFFDLDSSTLKSLDRGRLDTLAACLRDAGAPARVEGHADERGTTDYNLALGMRRAQAVRAYLAGAGVSAGQLSTTSYGEERPLSPGHNEAAWAQNRRAEVVPTR